MLFNTLSLLLALAPATLFAAPMPVADYLVPRDLSPADVKTLLNGTCDLSNVQLPAAPEPLPPPSRGLSLAHIAIGRGTQNYTCITGDSNDAPVANGAMATLFNATCQAVRSPEVLAGATKHALTLPIPTSDVAQQLLSGYHIFTEELVPFFDLELVKTPWGNVHASKAADSPAPKEATLGLNGLGSVPWLKLTGVEGDFKEIYRVRTAGGVAPKTCRGLRGEFTVEYAAEYWFYA